MLAIQVCQSLVFVTALQILLSDPGSDHNRMFYEVPTTKKDGLDLLLLICLLYVLIRIPSWVSRTIWRQATPRLPGQILKTFLIYRGAGALFSKATGSGRHRHGGGHGGGNRPGGGGSGGSSGPAGPGPGGGRPRPNRGPSGGRPGAAATGGTANSHPGSGPGTGAQPGGTGTGPQPSGAGPVPHSGRGSHGGPTTTPSPRPTSAHRPTHGGYPHPSSSAQPELRPPSGNGPSATGQRPVPIPRRPRRAGPRPTHEVITLRLEPRPRHRMKKDT
jgi:hypothetical protein